jgi:hypothetical protein
MARGLAMKREPLAGAVDRGAGFERYRRRTKREDSLDAMNAIGPWAALCAVIEPHYPKAGNGHRPIGLERMLRIHLLQHWFNPADNCPARDARQSATSEPVLKLTMTTDALGMLGARGGFRAASQDLTASDCCRRSNLGRAGAP